MPSDDLLDAIRSHRRRPRPADRSGRHRGLLRGLAAAVSRPHPGGGAPRHHRGTRRTWCGCAPRRRAPIVPQGGNTSMVGGAAPAEDGSELVLSLVAA